MLRTFVKEGAKEVQLDGFPWVGPPECYAEDHSHTPGVGGNGYAQESKSILKQIRQDLREIDDSVLISGEGISDFYLPYMDIHMSRDVTAEEDGDRMIIFEDAQIIPLTQYALGDHIAIRGDTHEPFVNADWTQPHPYLRLTIARSLHWGNVLLFRTAVDVPRDLESDTLLDFLGEVAWTFSLHGTRFLVDGRLLRPPEVDTGEIVEVKAKVNKSPDTDEKLVSSPAIKASAWESGDETERAIILSNIADSPQSTEIDLSQHPFSSEDTDSRILYTVSNGRYTHPQTETKLTVKLAPREVKLIVSTPKSDGKERALNALVEADQNPRQPQRLIRAKRAFSEENYRKSQELAASAQEKPESDLDSETEPSGPEQGSDSDMRSTETMTPTETTTSTDTTEQPNRQTPTATDGDGDETPGGSGSGFGLISSLTGIGSGAYLLNKHFDDDSDD